MQNEPAKPADSFGKEQMVPAGGAETIVKPTPDNPPWNTPVAFLVLITSIFLVFLFQSIFVGVYLVSQNLKLGDKEALRNLVATDPSFSIVALVSIIPAHLFTLVLSWLVVTKVNKFSFRQTLGWEWGKLKIWHTFVITILFLVLGALLVSIFGEQDNEFKRILQSSRTAVYLVAFFATFTAPLVEEVVYRGILYSALQRTIGAFFAVAAVTLIFFLVHVPQYQPDYVPLFMLCLLSLVLTLIRAKSGNLLPCIVLHLVFNGIQSLFLVFEPVLQQYAETPPEQINFFLQMLK